MSIHIQPLCAPSTTNKYSMPQISWIHSFIHSFMFLNLFIIYRILLVQSWLLVLTSTCGFNQDSLCNHQIPQVSQKNVVRKQVGTHNLIIHNLNSIFYFQGNLCLSNKTYVLCQLTIKKISSLFNISILTCSICLVTLFRVILENNPFGERRVGCGKLHFECCQMP